MHKDEHVTKQEFQQGMERLKNDIFDRLDDISGQLETIRQEQTLGYHQEKKLEEKVDDHEKRITTLEDQKN